MDNQEWREPEGSDPDNTEHVTDNMSLLIANDYHIGLLTWRLFADIHQFTAMKEVGTWKFRHLLALEVDGCYKSVHVAKIIKSKIIIR